MVQKLNMSMWAVMSSTLESKSKRKCLNNSITLAAELQLNCQSNPWLRWENFPVAILLRICSLKSPPKSTKKTKIKISLPHLPPTFFSAFNDNY